MALDSLDQIFRIVGGDDDPLEPARSPVEGHAFPSYRRHPDRVRPAFRHVPVSLHRIAYVINGDLADGHRTPVAADMVVVDAVVDQADEEGYFTASSMYMAWKGWSFANKKEPSPWLTFLVLRIQQRVGF